MSLAAIGDFSVAQYILVAGVAFLAAVIGGISGYGTGLLLPPVLVPLIGPAAVVPVISLSALMTNASRVAAFRADFDKSKAMLVAGAAFVPCLIGAYGYTRLSGAGVSLLIGSVLILLVPLRRTLARRHRTLGTKGLAAAGSGYGLLTGGTSGAGVVLLSILLAAGLQGPAVIATDAGISILLGLAKVSVFQTTGALPASSWIMAGLIGVTATPGAFVAKRLTRSLSHRSHARILDGVVILGGILLVAEGLKDMGAF